MPIRDWNAIAQILPPPLNIGLLSAYKGLKRVFPTDDDPDGKKGLLSAYKGLKRYAVYLVPHHPRVGLLSAYKGLKQKNKGRIEKELNWVY